MTPEALLTLLVKEAFGQGEAGVNTIYAAASDKMRNKVGSVEVFKRAFGNELYAPLLNAEELHAGEPMFIGSSARVTLTAHSGGERVNYDVGMALSPAGVWQLTGVVREGVDL